MSAKQLTCNETFASASHRIFLSDLNEHETVFGGRILSWVDDSASISCERASRQVTVTASLDHINFIHPVVLQDGLDLQSYVTGAGHRSLEVFVKGVGEHLLTGEKFLAFSCFSTFVTLSKSPNPALPEIVPVTDEQKFICAGYDERNAARKAGRAVQKDLMDHLEL